MLAVIGVYLMAHFAMRFALSPNLGVDDSEQILFAQQWVFGYRFRQPPLFTWLLLPAIDLAGPGVLAVSIVRYGLLALTYVFLYLTARRVIRDPRLAALSVLSFATIYVFAFYAHHDLTHTTALGAMIAATFYVFARLVRQPTTPHYLWLGLCLGLGMLSKWNFAMLALGLPLTCLVLADHRHLVLTWRSVTAMAVMAAIVAPTAIWMVDHGQSVRSVSDNILTGEDALGGLDLLMSGGRALAVSAIVFPLPFLLIFLPLFGSSLLRGVQRGGPGLADQLQPRFLGWLILVILLLHGLLIPVFGAVSFTERWMHPALMILPLYLFAVAGRGRPTDRIIGIYLLIIGILVAVAAGARLYRYAEGSDRCGTCREFVPFAELANAVRTAGFTRGTIVADGMYMGGNLRMHFPDSRVIDPAFPLVLWPALDLEHDKGMCLLVWRDDLPDARVRKQLIVDFAAEQLGVPRTAQHRTGRAEALMYGSSTRSYALGFELIPENAGGCR